MGEKSTSQERISALNELRYVARDAPELALAVFEHIGTFVVQAPTPDGGNDYTPQDFRVGILSAEFALDRIVKHKRLAGNTGGWREADRDARASRAFWNAKRGGRRGLVAPFGSGSSDRRGASSPDRYRQAERARRQ